MGCSHSSSVATVEVQNSKNVDSIPPKPIADKLSEAIIRIEQEKKISTGFFIKININKKTRNFILTSAYSITKEDIDSKKTISIFYGEPEKETEKKIELDNNKRFIECFIDDDIDATIIEILPEDEIPENKYLYPDLNYESGFDDYINSENDIFTAGYFNTSENKYDIFYSKGQIIGFKNNKNHQNFLHDCDTKIGLSGSPIVDSEKNVIGINLQNSNNEAGNNGVFIGAIIKKLVEKDNNQEKNEIKVEEDNNIIKKEEIKSNQENNNNNSEEKKIDGEQEIDNDNENEINEKVEEEEKESDNEEKKGNKNSIVINIKDKDKKFNSISEPKIGFNPNPQFNNQLINNQIPNQRRFKPSEVAMAKLFLGNPQMLNLIKMAISNQSILAMLKNDPKIKRLQEKQPIFSDLLNNPDLLSQLFTTDLFNTFEQMNNNIPENMIYIKNNNNPVVNINTNINTNINNINTNTNNLPKEQIDFYNNLINSNKNANEINNLKNLESNEINKMFEEFIKNPENCENLRAIKDQGFTDEKKIMMALIVCDGNLERAINYLIDENNND